MRVNAHQLQAGLNQLVFESENDTFRRFETILARPNFTHLHLDLMVDPYEWQAEAFQSGLLKRALAGAASGNGLEHLSIGTNMEISGADGRDDFYVPLETIFDPSTLSRIQNFGLSRFYVKDFDLLILLASLPHTLRSVELNLLQFMDRHGNLRDFLNQVRDDLGWQDRAIKPRLWLSVETLSGSDFDKYGSMMNWINSFMREGKILVKHPPTLVMDGYGRIKDAFMPEYERIYIYISAFGRP